MELKEIKIDEIDFADVSYAPTGRVIMPHFSAVSYPPIIVPKDRYKIVTHRYLAEYYLKNNARSINALLINPDTPDIDLLFLSLSALYIPLSTLEKSFFINRFKEAGYSFDNIVTNVAPLIGLPPEGHKVRDFESLWLLDDSIKLLLKEDKIVYESALTLGRLPESLKCLVIETGSYFCLNHGQWKSFVSAIEELYRRNGIDDIIKYLSNSGDMKIAKGYMGNSPGAAQTALFNSLERLKYPTIHKIQQEIKKLISELNLPNDIRLYAPASLEEGLHCEFSATSSLEFLKKFEILSKNLDHKIMEKIFFKMYGLSL